MNQLSTFLDLDSLLDEAKQRNHDVHHESNILPSTPNEFAQP